MKLTLTRDGVGVTETLGRLTFDPDHEFQTLEPPWLDNQHNISCIPTGTYKLRLAKWKEHGDGQMPVYEICDVPNERLNVWLHIGNTYLDTKGCPLLGLHRGVLAPTKGAPVVNAVLDSKAAYDQFMALLAPFTDLTLEIV